MPSNFDSPVAMGARLKRCTPQDQVVGGMVLDVFTACRNLNDDATTRAVLQAVPDGESRNAAFRYPAGDLLTAYLAYARRRASEGLSLDDALAEIIAAGEPAATQTPLVKLVVELGKDDPHRLLSQLFSALKHAFTFGALSVKRTEEKQARLQATGSLVGAAWVVCIVRLMFRLACGLEPTISLASSVSDGADFVLEVSWR